MSVWLNFKSKLLCCNLRFEQLVVIYNDVYFTVLYLLLIRYRYMKKPSAIHTPKYDNVANMY